MIITLGEYLDGTPTEIQLNARETRAWREADLYSERLLFARRAALRSNLVEFLSMGGRIVLNLGSRAPGPGQARSMPYCRRSAMCCGLPGSTAAICSAVRCC